MGSIVSTRNKAYLSLVIEPHQFNQFSSPHSKHHGLILRWRKKHYGHDVQRLEFPLCKKDENINNLINDQEKFCSTIVTQRRLPGTPWENRDMESNSLPHPKSQRTFMHPIIPCLSFASISNCSRSKPFTNLLKQWDERAHQKTLYSDCFPIKN